MTMTQITRCLLALAVLTAMAAAQNDSTQTGSTEAPAPTPAPSPAPAFGQNAPILSPENPPISGLDEPRLDLISASRSFVAPAAQISESADTNAGNNFENIHVQAVTRFLGALDLQRFWSKTDFLAEYLGGGAVYSRDLSFRQMHAVGAELIDRWRTGQATLRDSFSYLPEGSFVVGAYGGMPGLGLANGGMGIGEAGGGLAGTHSFGTGQLGSIGLIPRLANTAILDMVQSITPRSAVTVAGGFSNAHFFDDTHQLINSDQTTIQAGFSRLVSRHDQLAAIYGYQLFRFPQITGGQIQNHIVNVRWSHTITGRLSLIAGAGPQYTIIQSVNLPDQKRWSANGRVQLHYKLQRTSFVVAYEKFVSAGSGFFAGADSQVARLGMKHPVSRTMDLYVDLGYSHNKRLQAFSGLGVSGGTYDEGFAGAVVRKHFGRVYDFFASYRFGEVHFDNGFDNNSLLCQLPGFGACSNATQRHTGTVGVEWHPTPTRIE
jgi:hypothetical protein